jgi:hypothetical protein
MTGYINLLTPIINEVIYIDDQDKGTTTTYTFQIIFFLSGS